MITKGLRKKISATAKKIVYKSRQKRAKREEEWYPACPICGHKSLLLSGENSYEDFGRDEDGIVVMYDCGWCDIGDWVDEKGKVHKEADSPKYRALGNSLCTPFWFWLLRRISAQYERPATLGSLFDGIGGFPYCWARCNGSKYVLWASEIEQFPIAVVKKHFGDEDAGIEGDIGKYL